MKTKKDETEPAVIVEDHKNIKSEIAEKLVDQTQFSTE